MNPTRSPSPVRIFKTPSSSWHSKEEQIFRLPVLRGLAASTSIPDQKKIKILVKSTTEDFEKNKIKHHVTSSEPHNTYPASRDSLELKRAEESFLRCVQSTQFSFIDIFSRGTRQDSRETTVTGSDPHDLLRPSPTPTGTPTLVPTDQPGATEAVSS